MKAKTYDTQPSKDNLQNFIDYSILHYDDLGRVLAKALKKTPSNRSRSKH